MSAVLFGNKPDKGILIVEVLISISIIAIALVSLLSLAVLSLKVSTLTEKTLQANNLGQEAVEAVRSFRDRTDWDVDGLASLSTGSGNPYHPESDAVPEWLMVSGAEAINGFTRKIVFERVSRSSDNIEDPYNPANNDPDTRKVIVTVSWEDKEVEIITYFTNWR
jgi:type II secretory pathway pseudopilin PulG